MNRTGLLPHVRPAARAWGVLVLAVLAGVLAMHALTPGGMPSMGEHTTMPMAAPAHSSGSHAAPCAHAAPSAHADACEHATAPGEGTSGAMTHTAGSCAAGKTSTPYAPPALTSALVPSGVDPVTAPGGPATADVDGRAPPDLAQLQVLRI